ncbi:histidine phosphatase family protein [Vibrio mediterranei]|uniref:Histidine phosphatase family protein n=1 Tax=Vibrio mediterranei TaxID=689 RepID=A0A3G4V8V6_9VIBR|nr:histidine phosphatase family protein [Vibrio mediterranei]AYV21223.1 histidine phosphatase family protein [Vibrio mediterranei]
MMTTDLKVTNIFVLRHGQSEANLQHLVCGQSDYPLTELGRLQAEKACDKLSNIRFDKVYCSPLMRATQTIEPLDLSNIVLVPEIMEVNTGEYSSLTIDELYEKHPQYKYQGLNADLSYPGGESLNSMIRRASSWFDSEKAHWKLGENILIVGHEGTLCAILHDYFNMDVSNYPSFRIPNCGYVKITINSDSQCRVQFLNMD